MNSSKDYFDFLLNKISQNDLNEKKEILFLIFEHYTGLSKTDILLNVPFEFLPFESVLKNAIIKVNNNEPVQYVLGETEFFSRKFIVNSNVLIPRPETEELVQNAIKLKPKRILDLGTGSGCIAISLFLELKIAEVIAVDISEKALEVANLNQKRLNSKVKFTQLDILKIEEYDQVTLGKFDMIVSNPPYVKNNEKSLMNSNVLDFEPHLALFVDDNDPLIYYRKIAEMGKFLLNQDGFICVEINSALGLETLLLFENQKYRNIEMIKDINAKDRIIIAQK